ncbi:hypothetical protein ES702_07523 [subsurface metagenome]
MKTKILVLGLICLFVFAHCNSPADPEIEKVLNPILPAINYFTVTPTDINQFQTATLEWKTTNANKVEIDNGIGEVALEGMIEVIPLETTNYRLWATNNDGQVTDNCRVEVFIGPANVEMRWGPTGEHYGNRYEVRGGVKNTGTGIAFNTKVSVELYGSPGVLLASGDCLVGGEGFKFYPEQQNVCWEVIFDDTSGILYRGMDWDSEITYEITWEDG